MSTDNSDSYTMNHHNLQQIHDRIAGNRSKPAYPQIIPQLYYAINDISSQNNDEDDAMGEKSSHSVDHNIPIISYDEEESGSPIIHTGTKNLETLTAPIRYRIKTAKKIIEDDLVASQIGASKFKSGENKNVILEKKEEETEESQILNKNDTSFHSERDADEMDVETTTEDEHNKKIKKNQLPLHILLKTEVSDWDIKIKSLEEELMVKKEKLKTIKKRILDIVQ
ncbi:hypothetical protein QEN19_000175 [Hanseniaspora menglaensis]